MTEVEIQGEKTYILAPMNFIDLFAGAGGLSEGFKNAGFHPIAHVELDKAACLTLKTRVAYSYLRKTKKIKDYHSYLKGEMSRKELYAKVPDHLLDSVINAAIGKDNQVIFEKIDELKGKKEIDLIVGGPPCQAYSYIGRAALKHKESDERKTLYIDYGKFLERYRPKLFVFENVPGLKTCDGSKHYQNLKNYFKQLGYEIDDGYLNAYDFGVVQNRERLFIIGWREELDYEFPVFKRRRQKWTRDDIFSDLPEISHSHTARFCHYKVVDPSTYLSKSGIRNGIDFVTQHITRPHNSKDLEIYRLAIEKLEKENKRLKNNEIPAEKRTQNNLEDFLDRFKVVDRIPHTMIAHIAKDGHHFIHPNKKKLRSISVREAARIQSFPDNFHFEGEMERWSQTAAFRQIGNAVPPLMAYKIASKIRTSLLA